ncbi:AzlC family ABC transporter permease [Salinisphaera sp. T31B1]|uniref:AzlC family ABC transporter permease n=1 Tax=Salinisphaera sp. T31B1 TaxID=727963 RepID=UPI00333EF0C7
MTDVLPARIKRDAADGARAILPLLISIMPFALIVGVVAVRLGYTPWMASAFSLFIFAGASQIAAMQLLVDGTPVAIILLTIVFINLRFTMYSASLAPWLRGASRLTKMLVGYTLTDQPYMLSLYAFEHRPERARRIAFFLGGALPLWAAWQTGTIVGALMGARLPADWGLDFAVPLTFIALLVPAIVDRAMLAAAIVGAVVATAAHGLPWNLGLMAGALAGIATGLTVERVLGRGGRP